MPYTTRNLSWKNGSSWFGQMLTFGKQYSGVVNLNLESPLAFRQINSIYYKNDHERLKLVSRMTLKLWNIIFLFETFWLEKRTVFSEILLLSEFFLLKWPSNWIFLKPFVTGKQLVAHYHCRIDDFTVRHFVA